MQTIVALTAITASLVGFIFLIGHDIRAHRRTATQADYKETLRRNFRVAYACWKKAEREGDTIAYLHRANAEAYASELRSHGA